MIPLSLRRASWASGDAMVLPHWFLANGRHANLYVVLDLPDYCDQSEITPAFHHARLLWHPERNKHPQAAEVFALIQRAYDVLSQPELRLRYHHDRSVVPVVPTALTLKPSLGRDSAPASTPSPAVHWRLIDAFWNLF